MILRNVELSTLRHLFRATRYCLLTGEKHRQHPRLQMRGDLMYLTTEHQASVVPPARRSIQAEGSFIKETRFHIEQACSIYIRSIGGQAGRPILIHNKRGSGLCYLNQS